MAGAVDDSTINIVEVIIIIIIIILSLMQQVIISAPTPKLLPVIIIVATWLSNKTRRWVNVRPTAAYRWTQRSNLQLDLQVGGHLALTNFHSEDHGFAS